MVVKHSFSSFRFSNIASTDCRSIQMRYQPNLRNNIFLLTNKDFKFNYLFK